MNVDQIYQYERDDAFARQFWAKEYSTFVAMPFTVQEKYPADEIKKLLQTVHSAANKKLVAITPPMSDRKFAPLFRVDDITSGTVVITDEIIRGILLSHFYVADLTGPNFGVVLETGIALALKPNRRVLAFTQDNLGTLHFDLKVTHIYEYKVENLVERIAGALVEAARAFESEADRYVRLISSQLTPDAISVLNLYGRLWKDRQAPSDQPGIWSGIAGQLSGIFDGQVGEVAFNAAVRELSARRLIWTDYRTVPHEGRDIFALHATNLGWCVIQTIWSHDHQMVRPDNALVGPTS